MKNPWLARFAAVAAGLVVAIQASPSTAATSCDRLAAAMWAHGWSGRQDPMKPVNVDAAAITIFNVTWDVPSTRPAGTVAGRCVHLHHVATGQAKEWCRSDSEAAARISITHCLARNVCPLGDYNVKVQLKNDCDLHDEWSDTVTRERNPNPLGDG